MELRQLRQFITVAETLNFHRASEKLHMAQPPLSTAIRKLEDELGVMLFNRNTRGLSLTSAGEVLLDKARLTLSAIDELHRCAMECSVGAQGRLVVGFSGTASYTVLPELIPRFQNLYPRIQLILQESTTSKLIEDLANYKVDIALLRTPLLDECTAELLTVERDRFALAVHRSNPLAQREKVVLAELDAYPFIIYSPEIVPAMHAVIKFAFKHAGISPTVVQEVVQVTTALGLVESGLGVAMVPQATARYTHTNVKIIPISDLPEILDIGIVLAHRRDNSNPPTQRFVEVASNLFKTTSIPEN